MIAIATDPASNAPPPNNKGYAIAVYLLYFGGFIVVITALVGVIIAHTKLDTADGIYRSHFQFQVRTFWIGLLYFVAGSLLLFFYVGGIIWLWWFVWTLVRVIKGLILLNDGRAIREPASWLFG